MGFNGLRPLLYLLSPHAAAAVRPGSPRSFAVFAVRFPPGPRPDLHNIPVERTCGKVLLAQQLPEDLRKRDFSLYRRRAVRSPDLLRIRSLAGCRPVPPRLSGPVRIGLFCDLFVCDSAGGRTGVERLPSAAHRRRTEKRPLRRPHRYHLGRMAHPYVDHPKFIGFRGHTPVDDLGGSHFAYFGDGLFQI